MSSLDNQIKSTETNHYLLSAGIEGAAENPIPISKNNSKIQANDRPIERPNARYSRVRSQEGRSQESLALATFQPDQATEEKRDKRDWIRRYAVGWYDRERDGLKMSISPALSHLTREDRDVPHPMRDTLIQR